MTEMRRVTAAESERIHHCLNPFVARVSKAVLPLFSRDAKRPPQRFGSCVLFRVNSARLVLTAAHVFDWYNGRPIWAGLGDRFCQVRGDAKFNLPPDGGDREADWLAAAVLLLRDDSLEEAVDHCLTPADLDVRGWAAARGNYLVFGYPRTKTKVDKARRQASAAAFRYVAADAGEQRYATAGVHRLTHVALHFNVRKIHTKQGFQRAPDPDGLSGTGIWAVPRAAQMHAHTEGKLAAILTEHIDPECLLIGTRVSSHLDLIRAAWPELGPMLLVTENSSSKCFPTKPLTVEARIGRPQQTAEGTRGRRSPGVRRARPARRVFRMEGHEPACRYVPTPGPRRTGAYTCCSTSSARRGSTRCWSRAHVKGGDRPSRSVALLVRARRGNQERQLTGRCGGSEPWVR